MKQIGAIHRIARAARVFAKAIAVSQPYLCLVAATIFFVETTGCTNFSSTRFAKPTADWQTRAGQLMYRNGKTTLIGEVLVRFSKSNDFELTFSKGPGVNLLVLRQNTANAEVSGALARMGWSGPIERAPKQLQSWLALRDKIISQPGRKSLRCVNGRETFDFRF